MSGNMGKILAMANEGKGSRRRRKSGAMGFFVAIFLLVGLSAGGYYLAADEAMREKLSGIFNRDNAEQTRPAGTSADGAMNASLLPQPPAAKPSPAAARQPATSAKSAPAALTAERAEPALRAMSRPAPEVTGIKEVPRAEFSDEQTRQSNAKLQTIDGLIRAGQLADADRELQAFVTGKHSDFHLAEAYYRLGLVARRAHREEDAQGYWDRACAAFPDTRCGRLSALAIADTRYARDCGEQPRYAEWEEIRDYYSAVIGMDNAPFLPTAVRQRVVDHLNRLNGELVFGDAPYSKALYHEVQSGEVLSTIARKYEVHYDSLVRINRVRRDIIHKGQKIKILKGECLILVDKAALTLTWYLDGKWIRQYPCCVGPANKTPAGEYVIEFKDANPAWTDPKTHRMYPFGHPENILGTRWMSLKGNNTDGLGIHGTSLPETIPGRTSNGCVRLLNDHVEELYAFGLINTRVVILD